MAKKRRKPRPRRPAQPRPQPNAPASEPEPLATETAAPSRPARAPRKQIEDERPPAPWGSFPLVELVVLVGLTMLVVGFFVGGSRGNLLLATGLALGSLAGLELTVREHFGGYRSHTLLLASAVGVAVLALLYYAFPDLLSPGARVGVAVFVAALAWLGLARAFRNRAGRSIKLR